MWRNIEYKQKQQSLICAKLSFECIIILELSDFRQRNWTPPPSKHMHLICGRWCIYECQTNYDASKGLFLLHQDSQTVTKEKHNWQNYWQWIIKQLDFFCGLKKTRAAFPPTVSPFPSFVKWGHEMLHNSEKLYAGGSHKKTNCACLEKTGVHSLNQSKPRVCMWRSLCQRCALALVGACWCWGSAAHGAANIRCHVSGVT